MAGSAFGETASPWWHLTSSARPTVLRQGGTGLIGFRASNLGDASVNTCLKVAAGTGRYNEGRGEEASPPGSGEYENPRWFSRSRSRPG